MHISELFNLIAFITCDALSIIAVPYTSIGLGNYITSGFGQKAGLISTIVTYTVASAVGMQLMNVWRQNVAPEGGLNYDSVLRILYTVNILGFLNGLYWILVHSPTEVNIDEYGLRAGSILYICFKIIGYNTDNSHLINP